MAELPLWVVIALPASGYVAAAATEYLRGRQALTRERESRREAREAARQDARDSFERDSLLELQEAMAVLMRNFARIHHENEMEYQQSGLWGRGVLPKEIGGEAAVSKIQTFHRLRVRVLDRRLRSLCEEWLSAASGSAVPALREEDDREACLRATKDWQRCFELYTDVVEGIGARLRHLISTWDHSA